MASSHRPLPTAAVRRGRLHFANRDLDNLLAMVLTLSGEVWALRERCAVIEAIASKHGIPLDREVEDFEFEPEQDASLAQLRNDFMANLFRILDDGVAGAARSARKPPARKSANGSPAGASRAASAQRARKTSGRPRRPK